MDLREKLERLVAFFSETDERSWAGHAVQAVIFTLPFSILAELTGTRPIHLYGLTFTVGAFFHRELDNFVDPLIRVGWKFAVSKLRNDGIADFMAPYAASCATIVLVGFASNLLF